MTDIALLHCPFCGTQPSERMEEDPNGPKLPNNWFVLCGNLDCTANPEVMEKTQEAARIAWNTRAQPTAAQSETSPLREIAALRVIMMATSHFAANPINPVTDNEPSKVIDRVSQAEGAFQQIYNIAVGALSSPADDTPASI